MTFFPKIVDLVVAYNLKKKNVKKNFLRFFNFFCIFSCILVSIRLIITLCFVIKKGFSRFCFESFCKLILYSSKVFVNLECHFENKNIFIYSLYFYLLHTETTVNNKCFYFQIKTYIYENVVRKSTYIIITLINNEISCVILNYFK